ncbi:phosphoribosylaminoimidazole-succinocarboxamide synthase [Planctomycetota bacterium]|nr:phosphoribosylaminoimidazole-succinocarboxamide synthase [Planctomycetota bacterium]
MDAITTTNLAGLELVARGKVRDVYSVDADLLLFVATDRISAFDVVMTNGIPGKGVILTALSRFWFDLLQDLCPNHLVTTDLAAMPATVQRHGAILAGRSMLVRRLAILPVEAIVRGYLAGTGWKEYRENRTVCRLPLPQGLQESSRLPEPIYTPSTKAEAGRHDQNIHPEQAARLLGPHAGAVRNLSLALYGKARDHARSKGLIIADTKFEFGVDPAGQVVLADEVLTPDSSRFWPLHGYAPGRAQDSFDKQYVRDYLERIQFNKDGPGIVLPDEVVQRTLDKYREAFRLLTGHDAPA